MTLRTLTVITVTLAALGAALVVAGALSIAYVAVATWISQRVVSGAVRQYLRINTPRKEEKAEKAASISVRRRSLLSLVWGVISSVWNVGASLLLAVASRDLMLGAFWFAVAFVLWQAKAREVVTAPVPVEAMSDLVAAFKSVYTASAGVFNSLALAVDDVLDPTLVKQVRKALRHYNVTRDINASLGILRELHDPYLDQFVSILERATTVDTESIIQALDSLDKRLYNHKRLQAQANVTLAILKGEVSFFTIALFTAAFIGVSMPMWRAYFTGSTLHRVIYMVTVVAGLGMSLYFREETRSLQENAVL